MDTYENDGVVEEIVDDVRSPFVHRAAGPCVSCVRAQYLQEYVIESWVPVLEVRIKTHLACTASACVRL